MAKVSKQNLKKKIIKKVFPKEDIRKLTKLVSGKSFDLFIMGIIFANAIVLGMMTSETLNLYFDRGLFLLDRLFMGIFIVEMFLKLYALKKGFFSSGWNIFDLVVVGVSTVPVASGLIVLRTFRLFRLFKYIHHSSKMSNIVQMFIDLIPAFVSFLAVFAVVFYVYAIMAVMLFGDVFASFGDLGSAMFTLLQVFTLDGWASAIARPIMLLFPHAWVFFFSLLLLSFLLVVSFLAVVVRRVVVDVK